jgi:hypothetical protein
MRFLRECRHLRILWAGRQNDPTSDFVICIDNANHPASLILGKVYRRVADADAETHDMLRVLDEDTSEPDGYLYPASIFAPIELPESAQRALALAGRCQPGASDKFWKLISGRRKEPTLDRAELEKKLKE